VPGGRVLLIAKLPIIFVKSMYKGFRVGLNNVRNLRVLRWSWC